MDADKDTKSPAPAESASTLPAPAWTLEHVKDIIHLFANTVSSMKLFPPHHSTVANFQNDLFVKLKSGLQDFGELEIGIDESSFLYGDHVVFADTSAIKNLPYLFFKDGLQRLAFAPDLEKEELQTFLETVRQVSIMPPDIGDIVDALWEHDFTHIAYYAPDEFLENKLRRDQLRSFQAGHPVGKSFEIKIDRAKLFGGRLELLPDDAADVEARLTASFPDGEMGTQEFPAVVAALDRGDMKAIEAMLKSESGDLATRNFLEMMFELLYLEDRFEQFRAILGYLEKRYEDFLRKADFADVILLLAQVEDLAGVLAEPFPERAHEVHKFLRRLRENIPLEVLLDHVRRGRIRDPQPFIAYLRRLGRPALPLAVDLLEVSPQADVRAAAFDLLVAYGKEDIGLLVNLVQDRKPFVARAVIAAIGEINDKTHLPVLARFLNSKDEDVRLAAVGALGQSQDILAQKILLSFFRDDASKRIRIEAASRIRCDRDVGVSSAVLEFAARDDFAGRATLEKEAALVCLGRSMTEETRSFFGGWLEKRGLLVKPKVLETQLSAVKALETLGTPEATALLESALKKAGSKVRSACRAALERLEKAAAKSRIS
jgi:hypothetical protein